jgi:hypothetical protein
MKEWLKGKVNAQLSVREGRKSTIHTQPLANEVSRVMLWEQRGQRGAVTGLDCPRTVLTVLTGGVW